MGVHGLWDLLAPAGRRVSVETLAGKKLAIDASIWMVQFMKAMRDEKGEMVRNAHLLGFFRRICKLLFLRARPIFVFDGATPALKRRTVMTRRRHRENAQAKVRKTAEKLLLNHLKAMKLKELADDIKNQRQKPKNDAKGEVPNVSNSAGTDSGKNDVSSIYNQEKIDEMLAASIMAEEDGSLANNSTMSAKVPSDEDGDEDEEMILPDILGEVDPAVLAALTPSLQRDLLQKQNDAKGKGIVSDKVGSNLSREDMLSSSSNQQKLDEMLAASLMEEEKRNLSNNGSTPNAPYLIEEDDDAIIGNEDEDEDEDEEMIVPAMYDGVDPSILAALPPSMQLDLLVQIRERLMAENRQKYQKVKKDPGKFSELQIQAYLKTVAFRREIDQVQKAATGRGVGGVQTSRIASEANREFIFSSSFTGDRQVLTSGNFEKRNKQHASEDNSSSILHAAPSTSNPNTASGSEGHTSVVHSAASTSKSKTVTGLKPNGDRRVFDGNIETYVDERGRVRVSKTRAMGIRMTRDIQRNLDLMKEIEQERQNVESLENEINNAAPTALSDKTVSETSHGGAESIERSNTNEDSMLKNDPSIEISFEHNGEINCLDDDDDIFTQLVADNPISLSTDNVTPTGKLSSASDSECEWEEGIVEAKGKPLTDDANLNMKPLFLEVNTCDDSEVEWEEEDCEITEHTVSSVAQSRKMNSKGNLEEEADLQEAIRRSLGELEDKKSDNPVPQDGRIEFPEENASTAIRLPEVRTEEPTISGDDGIERSMSTCESFDGVGVPGVSKTNDSLAGLKNSSIVCNPENSRTLVDTLETHVGSHKQSLQVLSIRSPKLPKELPREESVTASGLSEVNVEDHICACNENEVGGPSTSSTPHAKDKPQSSDSLYLDVLDAGSVGDEKTAAAAEPSSPLIKIGNSAADLSEELADELIRDIDDEEKMAAKIHADNGQNIEDSTLNENEYFQAATTHANLEEELRILDEERMDLGEERRRLERNAESVSSEMYTECQELLQMFGIPYIIAPMEAEAQCAFMELANLVDGVVTDDSDVFLFGARSVYKNIFDDRKYVETYFMKDIESELGLTREKLIRIALLLGSDYTEGISGIGIVNAIEVLNAFPEEDGLQEFRNWIESPDPTILSSFSSRTENSYEAPEQNQSADPIQERRKLFMDKHRKVSKNWHIPSSFPSRAVIAAYLSPEVDKSTETFTWGKPDHFVLRKLCWEKFCWSNQKADELILPVLKEYSKRETQRRLEEFYTFNERFAKIRSKRIKKAVKGITGKKSLELMDEDVPEVSGSENQKTSEHCKSGDDQQEQPQGIETNNKKRSTPKQSRKRTKPGDAFVSESPVLSEGIQRVTKSRRTRPSGSGRGRGRGRGKRKESLTDKVSETSSSNDEEENVLMQTQKGPAQMRRSARSRKHVDYTANDSETDDLDNFIDKGDKHCFVEESSEKVILQHQDQCENDASEFGEEKLRNTENVSPDHGLDTVYLKQGGGFCFDDNDNDQPVVEEDFKSGGGFCTDEDETCPGENSLCGQATIVTQNVSEPNISDSQSTEVNDQSESSILLQETDKNVSSSMIPVGTLRSMPHLRRKRRKS